MLFSCDELNSLDTSLCEPERQLEILAYGKAGCPAVWPPTAGGVPLKDVLQLCPENRVVPAGMFGERGKKSCNDYCREHGKPLSGLSGIDI